MRSRRRVRHGEHGRLKAARRRSQPKTTVLPMRDQGSEAPQNHAAGRDGAALPHEAFFCIAGPCVIESRQAALECAQALAGIFQDAGVPFYFKASFDKANRSSISGFRGPGLEEGLDILADIKQSLGLRVLTDIHEAWQAAPAAQVVDVLQIPALLCRQTDLLVAAAATGARINIKKGQFLAPWDMVQAVEKARAAAPAPDRIWVCERGTSFGYNNLVVDMRSLPILARTTGCPVVFDTTHSVQLPGANRNHSGGQPEFIPVLSRAALATGWVSGLFLETHPCPEKALCDAQAMLALGALPELVRQWKTVHAFAATCTPPPAL